MKRRTVFKHLAIASAAAWVLPSCISDPKKVSVALNHLQITGDEEELLGDIADVIIPATGTPGARAVDAHLFTIVMVDDCLGKEDQEKYLQGMRGFSDALKKVTGKSFAKASAEERLDMLAMLEQRLDETGEETRMFYRTTRGFILQGYLQSKYFMTEVKPYQLVPGPHYQGCVPAGKESKTVS